MIKYSLLFLALLITPFTTFAQEHTQKGFLRLNLDADSAYAVINNDFFDIRKVSGQELIKLPEGQNLINLSVPFAPKFETRLLIVPSDTTVLSHEFRNNQINVNNYDGNVAAFNAFNANIMIYTDDNSEIYLGDEYLGKGFATLKSSKRNEEITIKNSHYGKEEFSLKVKEKRVNVYKMVKRPLESNAKFFSLLPGVAQFYKRQRLRSLAFAGASFILITSTVNKFNQYKSAYDIFKSYKSKYEIASTESLAKKWGDLAYSQQAKVRKLDNQRRFFLISSIFVYAYNIYDGMKREPDGGYQKDNKPFRFYIEAYKIGSGHLPQATLIYRF